MNAALRASVIITGDASGLRAGVRDAAGAIQQLGAETRKAGGTASSAGTEVGKFDQASRNAVRSTSNLTSQLRSLVAIAGTVLGIRQLTQWADGWKQVEGRLSLVTRSSLELKAVQEQLFNVAQRTGQAYQGTATLYSRLAQSTRDLGLEQQQLIKFTETIGQAFVVSGSGAAESQAAIVQLSQAIASGVLRGDEFNSVMEQAPRLQQAMRDSLGKTSGELRKMAEQGQLTVQMILQALSEEAPKIAADFQKMPLTIGRSLTQLSNSLQRLVGMGDAVGGTSALIAASISGLAVKLAEPAVVDAFGRFAETLTTGLTLAIDAVTALAPLMSALTAIMAGLAAVQIGTWIAGLVSGLVAATAAGMAFVATPFGAAIAAIGVVTAGIAALWLESEKYAAKERAVADALRTLNDVRGISNDKIREMTTLERALTAEKAKQAIATTQQALAEKLRIQETLQAELDRERSYMSPAYDESNAADPANTFGRIPMLKNRLAANWAGLRELSDAVRDAKIELNALLAGDTVAANDNLGGGADSTLSDKIAKARAGIEALRDTVLDLNAQQMAAGQGGLAALLDIQDAQKARQMLLEFGEAAELGTSSVAALEAAAGATTAEIAAWLATQRELTESIGETVEQLNKLAEAPEIFADFVADLELQNKELSLEIAGRKALIPLLRAEAQLKERMGRDLTPEERRDLEEAIAQQERLNQTISDQEAAQEAAKKSAEMMQEPFKNALRGIQQAFSDTFRQILDGNIDSFKDMGSAVLNIFKQLAAEIATLLVFRPVVGNVLGGLGLGDLAGNLLGAPGAGGGFGSLGSLFGGSGAGTASTAAGGGFSLSNIFGGLGLLGNGSSGVGTLLFGTAGLPAVGGSHPLQAVAGTSGLFGSGGGGQFGALLNTPLGGGIAGGLTSLAFSAIMNGGKISTSSLISAGLTGIGTALGGPIGGIVGGLLGSVIGGLFGKKPKWKKSKLQSGANLGFDENGLLGVLDTYSITKRMDPNTQIGEKLGNSASDAFNQFMASIGADFDPSLTGDVRYLYRIKKKGKKTKGARESWAAWFGGEHLGTTQNADELMPIFLSGALAVASEQGKLSGLSPSTGKIFESLFNENNRQGITDQSAIQEALDFGKFYDEVDRIRTPADAAAKALRELKSAMMGAKADADAYGLSLDKIDQIFRNQFSDEIEDQILALTDPQALALREEEKAATERIALAQQLGADLARVEELNALKRKEVLAAGLSGINSMLRDFFDELTLGDLSALSPGKQFEQARGRYQDVLATGNEADFIDAARDYLNVAKGYLGTTEAYAKIFAEIVSRVRQLGDIPGFAGGGDHGGGWRIVGEKGIELEATGPARYFSHQKTVSMLREAANSNVGFGRRMGLMTAAGANASVDPRMLSVLGQIRDQQDAGLAHIANSFDRNFAELTRETRRMRNEQAHDSNRRKFAGR